MAERQDSTVEYPVDTAHCPGYKVDYLVDTVDHPECTECLGCMAVYPDYTVDYLDYTVPRLDRMASNLDQMVDYQDTVGCHDNTVGCQDNTVGCQDECQGHKALLDRQDSLVDKVEHRRKCDLLACSRSPSVL
jgi:hypothetical protein